MEVTKGAQTTVREGSDLDIDCQAEGVPRNISYSWSYRGDCSPDRDLISHNDKTLRLRKVTYKDTGSYLCEASNTEFTIQATFTLTVLCEFSNELHFHSVFIKSVKPGCKKMQTLACDKYI